MSKRYGEVEKWFTLNNETAPYANDPDITAVIYRECTLDKPQRDETTQLLTK